MMNPMADSADSPDPATERIIAADGGRPHRSGGRLRIVLAAVVIGALAIAGVLIGTGTLRFGKTDDKPNTEPRLTRATSVLGTASPGDCLTWSTDAATEVREVDCAQPHRFEVAGPVPSPLGSGAAFPGDDQLTAIQDQQCAPVVSAYLGHRLDPMGRFQVGLLAPQQKPWEQGERAMQCGIKTVDGKGAALETTGTVAHQDQSLSWPAGTCIGITAAGRASAPVDCSTAHAFQVTAVVDLGARFPGANWPTTEQQEKLLGSTCPDLTARWFGSPDGLRKSTLQLQWNKLTQPAWNAGARRVLCFVASSKDGQTFVPITGAANSTSLLIDGKKPQQPTLPAVTGAPAPPAARPGTAAPGPAPSPGR
jgi:hypothetical protein